VTTERPFVCSSIARLHVEDDRDRAVVGELDGHACAEDATLHRDAERFQFRAERLVERFRDLRRRRFREARAIPFPRISRKPEVATR
jgi:hypothetical protein